ncbi:glucosamine-6-phosphate deaminase [Chengkuizengella axinellae]|uniref:Glucosamine-6-phosphate deaminase n=1 Tax=Chengkuizengella axinellae TaxID=3064388 RepID=A0ABT9IZ88_9BACL|nr:glucosamine-6-phosphate deaminase [Chengkuizengella sp. 2205SS18-9]MDP5274673.1 glucosamine-6-phosphate deaminase [Chengkuizengella sp. 2205SS18-9]
MEVIKVRDYNEMSEKAAEYIIEKVKANSKIRLGLATGGTPLGLYKNMVTDFQHNNTSYRRVTSFNLDEYVGLSEEHPNSYRYYMNKSLFNHINTLKSNIHLPNGNAVSLQEECIRYDQLIQDSGGIDLQILGIGQNGHIGFNEPGTPFGSKVHVVRLTESTRQANKHFFNHMNEVPTHAITMGIQSIMKSKEILLLASGGQKSVAIHKLLQGEVSQQFPASILQLHPNVTVIADEEALSLALSYI